MSDAKKYFQLAETERAHSYSGSTKRVVMLSQLSIAASLVELTTLLNQLAESVDLYITGGTKQ